MFNSPARDGFSRQKKSDGKKARVASIWIFFFRGKECNTHQHPLDAPPGGIGRAMMSSLRFLISQNCSCARALLSAKSVEQKSIDYSVSTKDLPGIPAQKEFLERSFACFQNEQKLPESCQTFLQLHMKPIATICFPKDSAWAGKLNL